jgi:hypothetical protein
MCVSQQINLQTRRRKKFRAHRKQPSTQTLHLFTRSLISNTHPTLPLSGTIASVDDGEDRSASRLSEGDQLVRTGDRGKSRKGWKSFNETATQGEKQGIFMSNNIWVMQSSLSS